MYVKKYVWQKHVGGKFVTIKYIKCRLDDESYCVSSYTLRLKHSLLAVREVNAGTYSNTWWSFRSWFLFTERAGVATSANRIHLSPAAERLCFSLLALLLARVVLDSIFWRWLDSDSFPKQPDSAFDSSVATKISVDSTPTQTVQPKIESTWLWLKIYDEILSHMTPTQDVHENVESVWLWLRSCAKTMCMPSEKSGHGLETHTMLQQKQTIFMNRTWLILHKIHPEQWYFHYFPQNLTISILKHP